MKKRIRNLPFFDPDSKPMQVLGAFADMIVLNVCFLIGCLPVVTVGASMSALYAAMLRRQRGEGGGVFAAFWKDWKQNLRHGIACWLMQLAVTAFFAGAALAVSGLISGFPFDTARVRRDCSAQ